MTMEIWVLTGADTEAISHRRKELLETVGDREDCDCAEDGGDSLINGLLSVSMFSTRRVVGAENFDKLNETNLQRFLTGVASSDARVVARAGELQPATAKKLTAAGVTIERYNAARGKDIAGRVGDIANRHGISLGKAERALLAERCGHDLERVRSICWQLLTVGATSPTVRQLSTLAGSSSAPGVPWAVTDALDTGDTQGALRACAENSAGLAVLAYLSSQVTNAGLLIDAGVTTAQEAEQILGVKRFPATKALTLADRIGQKGVQECLTVLSQAETRAKTGVGERAAVEIAVAKLSPIWSKGVGRQ